MSCPGARRRAARTAPRSAGPPPPGRSGCGSCRRSFAGWRGIGIGQRDAGQRHRDLEALADVAHVGGRRQRDRGRIGAGLGQQLPAVLRHLGEERIDVAQSSRPSRSDVAADHVDGRRRHQEAERRGDAGAERHDDAAELQQPCQVIGMHRPGAAEGDQRVARGSRPFSAICMRVAAAMFSLTIAGCRARLSTLDAAGLRDAFAAKARSTRSRSSFISPPRK